jgi:hypothetical protein
MVSRIGYVIGSRPISARRVARAASQGCNERAFYHIGSAVSTSPPRSQSRGSGRRIGSLTVSTLSGCVAIAASEGARALNGSKPGEAMRCLAPSLAHGMQQTDAANRIKNALSERGLELSPRKLNLANNESWLVFESGLRQVGVDPASALWLRGSGRADWRCVAAPCSVSGVLMAVEFLTSDQGP